MPVRAEPKQDRSIIEAAIQAAVQQEILTIPRVDASRVQVEIRRGVVILTGFVSTETAITAVVRAAFRVPGVRLLACELTVAPARAVTA